MTIGTILGFHFSLNSGMATLRIQPDAADGTDAEPQTFYADSGPLGRALAAAFGRDSAGWVGRRVEVGLDDMGLTLGHLRPLD